MTGRRPVKGDVIEWRAEWRAQIRGGAHHGAWHRGVVTFVSSAAVTITDTKGHITLSLSGEGTAWRYAYPTQPPDA